MVSVLKTVRLKSLQAPGRTTPPSLSQAVFDCSVFTADRRMRSHPCVVSFSIIGGEQSHEEWWGWCGVYNTQTERAAPVFQLHVSLLSRVKKSRGQQRRDRSLNLTQVIQALLEIGQRPVWEVFLPLVLPSALCCAIGLFHVLQKAVHCVI